MRLCIYSHHMFYVIFRWWSSCIICGWPHERSTGPPGPLLAPCSSKNGLKRWHSSNLVRSARICGVSWWLGKYHPWEPLGMVDKLVSKYDSNSDFALMFRINNIHIYIYVYKYVCIYIYIYLPTYLSIYLSIDLPTYLRIYLPTYLSIHLFSLV